MLSRRAFLLAAAATPLTAASLTPRERVRRALRGQDVDRVPFSFWHHFGLEKFPGDRHAQATLEFHRKFRTDLVKVMSDYPYPKPAGKWWELKFNPDPFPEQIRALRLIHEGLHSQADFVETLFNPWQVAAKLSSESEVQRLKQEKPQALLDALEVIARSQASHARKAVAVGAAGVFVSITNANQGYQTRQEYAKFGEPFDRMIFQAVSSAPLNVLHLHGDHVYLDLFYQGWPAAAINYSAHGTGVGITEVRSHYSGLILGGLDERNYRQLQTPDLEAQTKAATQAAGKKFLLTPGCSVPNDSTDEELLRLVRLLKA
ncbi:MAG TPA: uroporphyrinogen decarboxylase family protein [Bryobacteraceae bacterium]|jgi:uroporphyrinogen decarboxylase|nr:uroporphyrinogen decarboxylase family protein [Bryobacteraceae bacterium]